MFSKAGRNLFGCVLLTSLFSLAVETVQLFSKVGAFDVDDILLNAIGGLVGWLCYCIFWNPFTKKK
jgi:glycopeptide antibiotics resistance protein